MALSFGDAATAAVASDVASRINAALVAQCSYIYRFEADASSPPGNHAERAAFAQTVFANPQGHVPQFSWLVCTWDTAGANDASDPLLNDAALTNVVDTIIDIFAGGTP